MPTTPFSLSKNHVPPPPTPPATYGRKNRRVQVLMLQKKKKHTRKRKGPASLLSLSVRRALGLLLAADLKVLAPLDGVHVHRLAHLALQAQHDLFGGLGLFVEDGLGLATVPALLPVVAPLALGVQGGFAGLVLGDLF